MVFSKNKEHTDLDIVVLLLSCFYIWVLLSVLSAKEREIWQDEKWNVNHRRLLQCSPAASKDLHRRWTSQYYSWPFNLWHACVSAERGSGRHLFLDPKYPNRRTVCWLGEAHWDIQFLCGLHFPHKDEENSWKPPVQPSKLFSATEKRKSWSQRYCPFTLCWLYMLHTSFLSYFRGQMLHITCSSYTENTSVNLPVFITHGP